MLADNERVCRDFIKVICPYPQIFCPVDVMDPFLSGLDLIKSYFGKNRSILNQILLPIGKVILAHSSGFMTAVSSDR
jgi:hypothetical protein